MPHWNFDNQLLRQLPGDPLRNEPRSRQVYNSLWSAVSATPVAAPRLLAWSPELAAELDLSAAELDSPEFAEVFAGNRLWPGMEAYATCYGGHQFGHWAGQLGDGRALHLGEIKHKGRRYDLQLKGAGPTPYSRRADGRAVLRSSLREFLCSEAMHQLGVPTTRALCLVATGESVVRDMLYDGNPAPEPGAIVCRVAPSFLRFGHYELPAARGEDALLAQLVDFTLARDFPELEGDLSVRRAAWFRTVCERTARLMADWMRVGFVHGVMNTDNMSILGLTIDYGPYGWVDDFDPDWTPNTTDFERRRYRFGAQSRVAAWNLGCMAAAISGLFDSPEPLEAGLEHYFETYERLHQAQTCAKFGLASFGATEKALITRAWELMRKAETDFTLFFRALARIEPLQPEADVLAEAFYDPAEFARLRPRWQDWLSDYATLLPTDATPLAARRAAMNAVNPARVLRNYLAQEAIDRAEAGDLSRLQQLQAALREPYRDDPRFADCAGKRPDWARSRPGCSMLSCSS
jgi:uncharacterized protein YdiU (UPF0061 family)